jgi:gliding motility-associated-like protein
MRFFKLVIRFSIVCFLVIGLFDAGYSQGCLGTSGLGPTGGATKISNGFACANIDAMMGIGSGAVIDIVAGDIVNGDNVEFIVDWDDGSPTPIIPANKIGPNNWQLLNLKHYFPTTGSEVKCKYEPSVFIRINGTICGNFGASPEFNRWNVDNENSGRLELTESITGVNTYLVCKGTETTVRFTDRSTLNCVPPEPAPVNTGQRWRRFTYGTLNTITSATGVEVNTVVESYPFLGGVITADPSQNPLPPTNTLQITIPDDAQVGEEFEIIMEYWNTCNPFPGTPVTQTARIRVVDQPPTPSPNNNTVCNATSPLPNFSINIPAPFPANSIVTWFQDNANSPGAIIPGFITSTLPASAIAVNGTIAGTYRVWASYFGVNNPEGLGCESARIPITLTIRENLPILPSNPTGYIPIICRDDNMTITLPNPPTETFGGATEYVWSVTGGAGVTFITTINSATFDFTGINFGGAPFVNRNIRVFRRYPPNLCVSPNRNLAVQIFAPSVGGSLSTVPDICETSPVGTINLTGERGLVQRWEVSFNSGPFIPNAGLGTATSISPGIVAPGNYRYRAIVANGTCAEAASTIEGLDVFPNPDQASVGANQQFCKTTLDSDPLGGNTPVVGTGAWSVFSRPGASTATSANFIDATQGNTIFNGDVVGVYRLRWTITSGICIDSEDIEIDFGTLPGPQDAGAAGPFCALSGALNASAPPTVGVGQWSLAPFPIVQPGTATFTDDLDRNTVVTVSTHGTYTFRWTVTSGICATSADDVMVRFTQAATAIVPPDFTICVDQTLLTPIDLTGSLLIGGGATDGRWEIVSGLGTIQSSGGVLGNAVNNGTLFLDRYIPTAGETSVVVRMVAQHPDPAACPNVNSADLTITIDRRPGAAVAGADLPACDGTPANLNAVPATNGGSGQWSYVSGLDNTPVFGDATDATTDVQVSLAGIYEYRWTVNSALSLLPPPAVGATCLPTSDVVQVTVHPLPVALDPTPNDLCEGIAGSGIASNVNLTAYNDGVSGIAGSVNRTVEWYTDASRTIGFFISTPTSFPSVSNGQTLFTRVINATTLCPQDGQVTFTINPLPIAVPSAFSFCEDFPSGSGQVTGNIDLTTAAVKNTITGGAANRTITWFEIDMITPVTPPNAYSLTSNKSVFARVVNDLTGCENFAQVDLLIAPRPLDPIISGSGNQCVGNFDLYNITPVGGAIYTWTIDDNPATEFRVLSGGTVNDFLVVLEFPNVYSGDVKVKVNLNGCESNEVTKIISVDATPPPVLIVASKDPVCENDVNILYTATTLPNTNYSWVLPGATGTIITQTLNQVSVNIGSTPGLISVTPQTQGGNCAGNPATFFIDIKQRPVMATIAPAPVCSDSPIGVNLSVDALSVPASGFNITNVFVQQGLFPSSRAAAFSQPSNAIAGDIFNNSTGGDAIVRYTVVPITVDRCEGTPRDIFVTIKPEPILEFGLGEPRCSGDLLGVNLRLSTNSIPADQYQIVSITNLSGLTAISGNPIIGFFNSTSVLADDAWRNTTGLPAVIEYFIRPINTTSSCVGDPGVPVTFTINPEPVVTAQTETICSGTQPTLSLASDLAGSTFTWTVKNTTGLVSGATSGSGTTITNVLINGGLTPAIVTYEVRAKSPIRLCDSQPQDIVITINPAPLASNYTETVCSDVAGGNTSLRDLSLLESTINNTGSVTFSWFDNGGPVNPPQLNAYTLTTNTPVFVEVDNGQCSKTVSVTYTINPLPAVTASAPSFFGFEITCNGAANAQINAVANFGTAPYEFSINAGANYVSASSFSPLAPNSYVIRVRDSKGCEANSLSIPITEPTPIAASAGALININCKGGFNGEINIVGAGGVGGYSYSLNGGSFQPSFTFTNLTAGTYTIGVRDLNGCTDFDQVILTEPPILSGSIVTQKNVDCKGNATGEVEVAGTGGTGPYEYSINNSPFQPSGLFNTLSAAIYTVRVRDFNFCTSDRIVTITEPAFLTVSELLKTNIDCIGNSTGSISVSAAGGTAPYLFAIILSGGAPPLPAAFTSATTFSSLASGTYTVFVRDTKNCVSQNDITITGPTPLVLSLVSKVDILCFGQSTGSITVQGSGGTSPYEYSLDGGPFTTSVNFPFLAAGNYSITTKDFNGCEQTINPPIAILQPAALTGTVAATSAYVGGFNVSCFNLSDGQITVTIPPAVGTAPYTFLLLQDPGNTSGQTDRIFDNVRAGNYSVRITDSNGCSFITATTPVTQPSDIGITIVKASPYNGFDISCLGASDGQVNVLTTTGGAGGYEYALDQDISNISGQANGIFTGLASGFYSITVTDDNNCTKTSLPQVLVDPLIFFEGIIGINKSVCVGSDPTALTELAPAFGGTEDYNYQWQESTDNVTFTDIFGANAATFDPPLIPVTTFYKRKVTAGLCAELESNVVKVTVNPLPTAVLSAPTPVCEGDFFILTFDFVGTAPFFFDYNDGTTFVNNRLGANNTPIPIINFSNNATYTITGLKDFNGCVATLLPAALPVNVSKINTNFVITSPSSQCSGGEFTFDWTVDADVEYTWIWNDGTQDIILANSRPLGINSIPHIYATANSTGNTNIPVILSGTNSVVGCGPKTSSQSITLFPNIFINVFPDKTTICSGETVKFTNNTTGGSTHRWFYREKLTTNPIFDERSFAVASTQNFVFTNTTLENPIFYEVVYEASNANCAADETFDITVYREVVASFTNTTPPPFSGGNATVQFTNTSTPIDASHFEYVWEFGLGANPLTLNSPILPLIVDYSAVGIKTIRLTASNPDALASGLTTGCASVFTKTIDILLPPLIADFKYRPQATCFPSNIEITENLATGDIYEWKLFSVTSGSPLLVSNEVLPIFRITNAGSYFIELTTTNSITGQTAFKDNSATPIEIFDLPFAAFEARPKTIFVPDEELILTNRSTDANQYDWDFDDGETSMDAEPTHFYTLEGKYTITLVAGFNHGPKDFDGDGIINGDLICYDTARQEINGKEGGLTRIPNAFTPSTAGPNGGVSSGGSFNDVFIPITKGVEEFEMTIFDRWGNLIFQSINKNIGWDGYNINGVLMPAGVYVYKLTMRLSNNQRTTQVGDVTLIR